MIHYFYAQSCYGYGRHRAVYRIIAVSRSGDSNLVYFRMKKDYGGVGEGFPMLAYRTTVNILYCCQQMSTSQFLSSGRPTREYYIMG